MARRGPLAWLALGVLGGTIPVAPVCGAEPPAALAPSHEYQVKAACLFYFAQFVEWPARAFADHRAPLVIGLLGDDPFGAYLDEYVRGEAVAGRAIVVRRFQQPDEIKDCHILFVSASETARADRLLAALKGRSILTVGDTENFSAQGGMVRLVIESGKLRLHINNAAAREAGLIISSKILRPATIVTREKR